MHCSIRLSHQKHMQVQVAIAGPKQVGLLQQMPRAPTLTATGCSSPCSWPQMAKSAAVVVKPTKKERRDR